MIFLRCMSVLLLVLAPFSLSADDTAKKPMVYFGINMRYQPIKMFERFQPLMDYLSSATPYHFHLKISRDYREALKLLVEGETTVASLGDGAAIKAVIRYEAEPVVKPLNSKGRATYRAVIVVPKRSSIANISELNGKRIALGYHHSTTGNFLGRAILAKASVTPAGLTNLPNHEAVIRAVLSGEYDAGAVKDITCDQLSQRGLRVIAKSDPISSSPLVARKGADPAVVKALREALVKLDPADPAQRKMLEEWEAEFSHGFAPASTSDYRDLIGRYRTKPYGCGVGCH